ncbi:MAG: hypothetical protein LBL46_02340 [Rickettsiales bacterium]|jgi:hypothetical protein|nr:hypothetical protein [Rickettsiales bacterium]
MKKLLTLAMSFALAACAWPRTPTDGDLFRATRQFQPELFATGSRGEVVVKMHDDQTSTGWFGKKYSNILNYKNVASKEAGYLEMKTGETEYATAMLPIGDYEITGMKLLYVWTETQRQGNVTITTTHIEEHDGFMGADKLAFSVRAGRVIYLGDIALHLGDNAVSKDDRSVNKSTYKITDKSAEISADQKREWEEEFGRPLEVGLIRKGGAK